MRKTTLAAALAATLSAGVLLTGFAAAETPKPSPSCATALTKYQNADKDLKAAVAADKALADADKAVTDTRNLASAADKRATDQKAIADAEDAKATTQQALADLHSNDTDVAGQKIRDDARKAAADARTARDAARAAVTAALADRDAQRAKLPALEAALVKAREDAKTDAMKLRDKRDHFKDLADKACQGPAGPTVTIPAPTPVVVPPVTNDNPVVVPPPATRVVTGAPQFVVVPNVDNGVNTGDGSLS